jgi:spermidine/putrescine transport system permease protein
MFSKLKRSIFKVSYFYVVLVLLLTYLPLFVIIAISFNPESERGNITSAFDSTTFDNYLSLFSNQTFITSLSNTIIIGVIVTPISVIIAVFTVIGLVKIKPFYRETTIAVANISLINPEVITALSLAILMSAT